MKNTSFTVGGDKWTLIHSGGYEGTVTVKMVEGDGVWLGEAYNGSTDNALFLPAFDMITLPGDTEIYALVGNIMRYPTARVTVTRNLIDYTPSASSAAAIAVDREFIPSVLRPVASDLYSAPFGEKIYDYDYTNIKADYALLYANIPNRFVQSGVDLTQPGNALEFVVMSSNPMLDEPPFVKITVDCGTRFAKLIPWKPEKIRLVIKAQNPTNLFPENLAMWLNFSLRKGVVPTERYFYTDYYNEWVMFNPEYAVPVKARVFIPLDMTGTYANTKRFGQLPNSGKRMTAGLQFTTQPSSTGGTATVSFWGLDGGDFVELARTTVAIPATGNPQTVTAYSTNLFWPFGTIRIVQTCTNTACKPVLISGYCEDT